MKKLVFLVMLTALVANIDAVIDDKFGGSDKVIVAPNQAVVVQAFMDNHFDGFFPKKKGYIAFLVSAIFGPNVNADVEKELSDVYPIR